MGRRIRTFAQEFCVKNVGKALHKAGMLRPRCRVGVAVSGGVDSIVLLKCLHIRQAILPFSFDLTALHVNAGFEPRNHAPLAAWLAGMGIAGHLEVSTHGLEAHSGQNRNKSACFRCAWLRRKRLFDLCAQYSLTHLALGHNADDLAETFFLNLCRNARVDGMSMRESFFGGKLTLIRPLLLVEKKYIVAAARKWNLPVFANPCPSAGRTARSDIAAHLKTLYSATPNARRCILNALMRWQLEKNRLPEHIDNIQFCGLQ
jgi:tRNA(Ile)-lysidine synthase TilS/MesJ